MKYNIVSNDGEASSITVFIGGESLVANSDHPNFQKIVDAAKAASLWGATLEQERAVRELFDLSVAVGNRFEALSERVKARAGRIFFDGVEVHNMLTETIVRFHTLDLEDFKPLVAFMEKIETNPNPHSREHLFRWLTKHQFTICPDGDFLAYKGVDAESRSITAGRAIVNNELVRGKVLNVPGTIIEMPRDEVQFDPRIGCSTGLHAGNWRYASTFGPRTLRVKINPRDVVSVPVDSNDEKLRICRYRVLDVVQAEDRSLLYLGDLDKRTQRVEPNKAAEKVAVRAEAKKAKAAVVPMRANLSTTGREPYHLTEGHGQRSDCRPYGCKPKVVEAAERAGIKDPSIKAAPPKRKAAEPKKAAPPKRKAAEPKKPAPAKLPRYYEQYKREHFEAMRYNDLRWLAREWERPTPKFPKKEHLVTLLTREATKRLRAWK